MPPLPHFSDNPLQTRDQVVEAAQAFLRPLLPYMSLGKGRIKIPFATGTHFDEAAAQLEGFARPLWAIGALLMGGSSPESEVIRPWLEGFETGTDPAHPDYWGPIQDYDQRMVEAEMISFALLAAPKASLWERLTPKAQRNLITWLNGMNHKSIHAANWLWFRVFGNLALLKVCGIDTLGVRKRMQQDLQQLDQFYMSDGWSSDGVWRSDELSEEEYQIFKETGRANAVLAGRQACYYSGSFAIQFSQLLYVRFAEDIDPDRTEMYRQRARDFGNTFWRFFDSAGAAIPFGRSLTYRFACGAFFAALALAKIPNMPYPLDSPGAIKGFLLRHLRWWARHSQDIFHTDGTLNLGWTYPQMYLTEDYNSSQSVYWALKSFIVVGMGAEESFWRQEETPYPSDSDSSTAIKYLPAPRHILCNHPAGNHHFLLATAQFVGIPFKGILAKYGKFAYSSSFGFSVPVGNAGIGQLAPDNTLALSRDGTETWAVKYKCSEPQLKVAVIHSYDGGRRCKEEVPAATVQWYPWADRSVSVSTTIIPPTNRWPDWHTRIHRIRAMRHIGTVFTAEGGFSINGRRKQGTLPLPALHQDDLRDGSALGSLEGTLQSSDDAVLILSEQGASGIVSNVLNSPTGTTSVTAFKPEPNTNVMKQRTLIPLVEHVVNKTGQDDEVIFVTKVFAVSCEANGGQSGRNMERRSLKQRWFDQPSVANYQPNSMPKDNCIFVTF